MIDDPLVAAADRALLYDLIRDLHVVSLRLLGISLAGCIKYSRRNKEQILEIHRRFGLQPLNATTYFRFDVKLMREKMKKFGYYMGHNIIRNKTIHDLYFNSELTGTEIGQIYKMSRQRVFDIAYRYEDVLVELGIQKRRSKRKKVFATVRDKSF